MLFGCFSRSYQCRRLSLIVGATVGEFECCLLFITGVSEDTDSIVLFSSTFVLNIDSKNICNNFLFDSVL